MGYPCYGKGKSADMVASDAVILPRGGYRPAQAAENPTLPHKCWYMPSLEPPEHACWLDGSIHPKEEDYGATVHVNQPILAQRNEARDDNDEFEDDEYDGDDAAAGPVTGVGHDPALNHRMKMDTLFGKGVFKIGDEWRFSFTVVTATGNVLVEKDAIVTRLGNLHGRVFRYPNFRYAPGQHKAPRPGTGQDLVLDACSGPQAFAKAMMDAWGPIPGKTTRTRGKAWKSIWLYRNGQNLGTLDDVRVAYDPNRTY